MKGGIKKNIAITYHKQLLIIARKGKIANLTNTISADPKGNEDMRSENFNYNKMSSYLIKEFGKMYPRSLEINTIYLNFFVILFFIFIQNQNNLVVGQSVNAKNIYTKCLLSTFKVNCYDSQKELLGNGSGFFMDDNGVGVTNYHVLENAYSATIFTADGQEYSITEIVWADKEFDIVKFKVNVLDKIYVPLKISKILPDIGESVYVIGSPQGLDFSISGGIISSIRKDLNNNKSITYYQTTTPISEGNSGSPLINQHNEVLGIISFYYKDGQNLNFAIAFDSSLINIKSENYLSLPLNKNAKPRVFQAKVLAPSVCCPIVAIQDFEMGNIR